MLGDGVTAELRPLLRHRAALTSVLLGDIIRRWNARRSR